MKKFIIIIGVISLAAVIAHAVDAYSLRDVRDPRKLATRLTDDFTSVVSTSDSARVTVLEATAVTNATLTQSKVAITASAAVATWTTNIITYLDATTNAVSSTNVIPATFTVAITNGAAVCTNVAITLIRK